MEETSCENLACNEACDRLERLCKTLAEYSQKNISHIAELRHDINYVRKVVENIDKSCVLIEKK